MFTAITYCYQPLETMYQDNYLKKMFYMDSAAFHSPYFQPLYVEDINFESSHYSNSISFVNNGSSGYRLDGEIALVFNKKIFYQWNYRVANNPSIMPGYLGPKRESIGDLRADFLSSSLTFINKSSVLSFSRGRVQTSHFGTNLLVNSSKYQSDNILFYFKYNNISLENIYMYLQPYNQLSRIIIYRRYGYNWKNYKIGFSELSLLAFERFNSMIYRYLMPYSVLFELEANNFNRSNLFWRFDMSYQLDSTVFWAELLIDDYAIDGMSPPKLGYLFGFKSVFHRLPYIFEAAKINRWVYNYGFDKPELRFVNSNELLGHPIGPDALQLSLSVNLEKTVCDGSFNIYPKVIYNIHGDGSLFEITPSESGQNYGYGSQKFLTGSLSHQLWGEYYLSYKYKRVRFKSYLVKKNMIREYWLGIELLFPENG